MISWLSGKPSLSNDSATLAQSQAERARQDTAQECEDLRRELALVEAQINGWLGEDASAASRALCNRRVCDRRVCDRRACDRRFRPYRASVRVRPTYFARDAVLR